VARRLSDDRQIRPIESEAATVLELRRRYASGEWSYKDLARWANREPSHAGRDGKPWTKQSIADVILNPIRDGQVIWHPGEPDEELRSGEHASFRIRPPELTAQLAQVRKERSSLARPSRKHRVYPYTGALVCAGCGVRLTGAPNCRGRRRMVHPTNGCPERSVRVLQIWDREIEQKIIARISLPATWRAQVTAYLRREQPADDTAARRARLERELERIR
jgi:hypothetical protein